MTSLEAINEAEIRRLVAGRHCVCPILDIHENQLGFILANSFRVTGIAACTVWLFKVYNPKANAM